MILPVFVLFLLGFVLTVSAPHVAESVFPAAVGADGVRGVLDALRVMYRFFVAALLLFGLLLWLRFGLLPGRGLTRRTGTWDCGYAAPDARMEYTATAFSQPLSDFFRALLLRRKRVRGTDGWFSGDPSYDEEQTDPGMFWFWERLFGGIARLAERVHILQSGYLHLYILIMTLALIAMLIWGLILPWGGSLLGKGGLI